LKGFFVKHGGHVIKVQNVSKHFGSTFALDNISFDAKQGEIVALLGPNGAGKTTTLRILSGIISPDAGYVFIDGHEVLEEPLVIKKKIGYLPENVPLYPEMRVDEFLVFRAHIKGMPSRKVRQRLKEVKELCGLEESGSRIIGQLSRGYHQRVGLADCLIHEPELLIMDEPTIGLDPNQIREVRSLIEALKANHTVVLSTHFLTEAEAICNRMVILNHGRIVASDTPEALSGLLMGYDRIVCEIYAPQDLCMAALQKLHHIIKVHVEPCGDAANAENKLWGRYTIDCSKGVDLREEIFKIVMSRNWSMRELEKEYINLEEVFVAVTMEGEEESK
jgi:ABC-2 type transport system ATP-binding protein